MDSSRRAVESYWRSRLIDGATSDEDKVTPVYKLEEICELLRTSHGSIVKEVSEFVLKRLDHKSPIVKQKALRLIKYAVGKSGSEFRREMQRNSAAVRQLFHYKGHPDPLKGDALNKAVRETAHEALSAMFSSEDNKVAPAEDLNKRIQGFGNTNFEMPSGEEKSFLSEVIGIGSATLKQGLSSLTQSPSVKRNDIGNYKGPTLRRSLTREVDYSDKYARDEFHSEAQSSTQTIKKASTGPWGHDSTISQTETTNGDASSSHSENKTREERLLETIVTSGGVRLQPTRDALQVFLTEASKLDALTLSHALESKLGSPLWQVRMKAVCVLEAILRKKDVDHFSAISLYFSEHADVIVRCSESPQASLREKANKVLSLLNGEQMGNSLSYSEKKISAEATTIQLPDLIDTDGPDDSTGTEDFFNIQSNQTSSETKTSSNPAIDDLFGDGFVNNESATDRKHEDDPFADVSFHTDGNKDSSNDIFSGMAFDKPGVDEVTVPANGRSEPFDIFGFDSNSLQQEETRPGNVHDLMAGLSVNENSSAQQMGTFAGSQAATILPQSTVNANNQNATSVLNGFAGPQSAGFNSGPMFPLGSMPYNMPPGLMFNPAFPTQPVNYGAMGNMLVQQQILATMSNFQQLGNLQSQNTGVNHAGDVGGMYSSSALPDIFNPSVPYQTQGPLMSSSKKEETKAFDFISDQLSSARDPKKVVRS